MNGNAEGPLHKVDWGLDAAELEQRLLYATPQALRWMNDKLEVLDADRYHENAYSPMQQAEDIFYMFVLRGVIENHCLPLVMQLRGKRCENCALQMRFDKATISRIINGRGNLTLKTIGDFSWVLGLRPDITFSKIQHESFDGESDATVQVNSRNKSEMLPHSSYSRENAFVWKREAEVSQTGSSK